MRLIKHSFKKRKYHNKPRYVDEIYFASIKEANRYVELKLAQKAGIVLFFLRQPMFDLGGGTTYKADFLIFYTDGRTEVEDVKGKQTDSFIKAKKQVEYLYPVTIRVL